MLVQTTKYQHRYLIKDLKNRVLWEPLLMRAVSHADTTGNA